MNVVIIKSGTANLQSVAYAIERLGVNPTITDDPDLIVSADKVILPGVGEASYAMAYLRSNGLDKTICSLTQPVLGICLGMQLLCRDSEEGNAECLGIFTESVKKFKVKYNGVTVFKVPQIGWNTVYDLKAKLYDGISENQYMYSVHSYYVEKNPHTISTSNYIGEYSSAIQKNNFYGVQFHPEKSGDTGRLLLANFLKL